MTRVRTLLKTTRNHDNHTDVVLSCRICMAKVQKRY